MLYLNNHRPRAGQGLEPAIWRQLAGVTPARAGMRLRYLLAGCAGTVAMLGVAAGQMSVDLHLDQSVYIVGEAVRADVAIVNHATTPFLIGPGPYRQNALFFQIKDSQHEVLECAQAQVPMIPELALPGGETYHGAFELDEWYPMGRAGSYIVTALVRRDDQRYESSAHAIDIVPGLEIKTAIQLFADRPEIQRKLSLVYFMRKQSEYLFLRITDTPGERSWSTLELGHLLRTTPPKIEVSADGVVTVSHRATRDVYLTTRVRSTSSGVELLGQEQLIDTHAAEMMQAQQIRALEEARKKPSHWWWPFGGSSDSKASQ